MIAETSQWLTSDGVQRLVTRQAFDAFGRVIRTGRYDYLTYNASNISTGLRDFSALSTLIKNSTGNSDGINPGLSTYVNGSGIESSTQYDLFGNKVRETNGAGDTLTWVYNNGHRLLSHTDLSGTTTTYGYNSAGGLVTQNSDRALKVANGVSQKLAYSYDEAGHLFSILDTSDAINPNKPLQTFFTDVLGRQVQDTFVDNAGISYRTTREYDSLGRLSKVTSDNGSSVNYRYDANSNRRRTQARWREGTETTTITANSSGVVVNQSLTIDQYKRKDYWYDYDNADRLTVSQGVLNAGKIEASSASFTSKTMYVGSGSGSGGSSYQYIDTVDTLSQGIQMAYNSLGERVEAMSVQAGGLAQYERYTFDANSRLQEIKRWSDNDTNRTNNDYSTGLRMLSSRSYDSANRITVQKNWDLANTTAVNPKETRYNRYDGTGQLVLQTLTRFDSNNQEVALGATGYQRDAAGNVRTQTSYHINTGGSDSTWTTRYYYDYTLYDTFKEERTYARTNNTSLVAGETQQSYDANGNLKRSIYTDDSSRNRNFITSLTGQIISKDNLLSGSGLKTQRYLTEAGAMKLSYGSLDTLDADQNYTPISDQTIGNNPGTYTVNSGDTLKNIAMAVWGDASLWYVIGEANGISNDSQLRVGQSINLPTRVNQNSNNSSTVKPYNPSAIIGDTTPSVKHPELKQCTALGQFAIIVITVIANYYGPWAAAAANFCIQEIEVAEGYRNKVSYGEVAIAAASSYISQQMSAPAETSVGTAPVSADEAVAMWDTPGQWAAMGSDPATGLAGQFGMKAGMAANVVNGAATNIINQSLNIIAGQQKGFDWRGVVAGAVMSPITQGISQQLGGGSGFSGFAGKFAAEVLNQGIIQSTQIAMGSGGKFSMRSIATNAFGQVLGQAIVEKMQATNSASENGDGNQDEFIGPRQAEAGSVEAPFGKSPVVDAADGFLLDVGSADIDLSGAGHSSPIPDISDNTLGNLWNSVEPAFAGDASVMLAGGTTTDIPRSFFNADDLGPSVFNTSINQSNRPTEPEVPTVPYDGVAEGNAYMITKFANIKGNRTDDDVAAPSNANPWRSRDTRNVGERLLAGFEYDPTQSYPNAPSSDWDKGWHDVGALLSLGTIEPIANWKAGRHRDYLSIYGNSNTSFGEKMAGSLVDKATWLIPDNAVQFIPAGALAKTENLIVKGEGALLRADLRAGEKALLSAETKTALSIARKAEVTIQRACFVAGTPVQTNNGLQAIDQLKLGDKVLSQNEQTGDVSYKAVVRCIVIPDKHIYRLTVRNQEGLEDTLRVTGNHPFWVENTGWVQAADLNAGDKLTTPEGVTAQLIALENEQIQETVYNIEVADYHTYFVGHLNILVHNDDCGLLQIAINVGNNEAKWVIDGAGRPLQVSGKLVEDFGGAAQGNVRSAVENALAKLRGKEGIAGDQGGHLAAFRFFKEQGLKNLFPQNGNFNTSAFKMLENDYAAALKVKGTEIEFSHKLGGFDANGRPSVVSVNSFVYRNNKEIAWISEDFRNSAKQTYIRIFDKTGKLKP